MKARLSFYAPDALPDVEGLAARYARLVNAVKGLIAARDFAGVLKVSFEIGRAAKALVNAKAQAAATERKFHMLCVPAWRARVISDLGGVRKLALWNAAMKRAVIRQFEDKSRWQMPKPQSAPDYVPAYILATQQAQALAVSRNREHIRDCARAAMHAGIFKDPFRVDQNGDFRLPPIPRAPANTDAPKGASEYNYDARKVTPLKGALAPAAVWPAEFFEAERRGWTAAQAVRDFVLGRTPGAKRRREHSKLSRRKFDARRLGRRRLKPRRAPRRKPVFAPP